ncbi:FtsX-like permease family protein [Streptomyces niveus]|uniref:FtsX-like permease family protein n=1 Tax=Streptomyces niveus TaxID=193462 RepID=UPI002E323731|nr:FtsX-like permease family protein [Streptomyces niveus]
MSALGRVVRSGVGRRRVQTLVIGLATLMAVTASVLAGSLLVASSGPFDDAFARQRGAHLNAQLDAGRATVAQLSASGETAGVSAASGPFGTVSVAPRHGAMPLPPLTVVGRDTPEGPVDELTLTTGSWAGRPGEIVLSAGDGGGQAPLGTRLDFPELPGAPSLEVVGTARSAGRTADAWVAPSQIASLTPSGRVGAYQMLYRFDAAATTADVRKGRAAVTASVPAGAVTGAQSWLTVRKVAARDTALFVPFLVAFGVLGLVMSVLVVGNVVAGSVGTGLRRIGILKAVGCTPSQVVRAYMAQALVPAAAGVGLGLLAGNLLAVPLLSETADAYGTSGLSVAPWIDVVVAAGALGVVTVTAWVSAWRAGRLRTVDALAVGRVPGAGRGRWAARRAAGLPLPRAVGLGLARPFARPARAAAMVAAVLFGAMTVTFAVGLSSSLSEVLSARNHDVADVTVGVSGQRQGPPGGAPGAAVAPAAVAAAIEALPGTEKYYGSATAEATVAGANGSTRITAFSGDASWGGYRMVSGRWFDAAAEAVVPTQFLAATGTAVGDEVTLHVQGSAVTVRVVGEVLDPRMDGMLVYTDAVTLTRAVPDLPATGHHIAVSPGTDVGGYVQELNSALKPLGVTAQGRKAADGGEVILVLNALTAILTLMLVAVAGLGVLGGVVLDTVERVRDLGVYKALGMTPRQIVAMVLTSVALPGLAGGALGVPAGVALHAMVMPAMGHSAGLRLPDSVIAVHGTPELLALGLGGVLIAVLGALPPAGWAARTRTVTALRTE